MSYNIHLANISTNVTGPPTAKGSLVPLIVVIVMIVVGVVGNSFVIMIVAMINSMKTTTNLLLVNIAIADIITLLLTGIHMILLRTIALDSSFLCKVIVPNTFTNVAILATSLNLTVLSIERYNALVKPMRISRRLTIDNMVFVIIGIWIISLVMNMPVLIHMDYDPVIRQCSPGQNNSSLLVSIGGVVLVMTIFPFCIIAFCYTQIISGLYFRNTIFSYNPAANPSLTRDDLIAKRKLVKLLVTITIIFFIAFVPYGVLQISIFSLTGAQRVNKNIVNLARAMMYLIPINSSINPFLYSLQSNNYRQGFKVLVRKMLCMNNNDLNVSTGASTHRTPPVISYRQNQVEI